MTLKTFSRLTAWPYEELLQMTPEQVAALIKPYGYDLVLRFAGCEIVV